MDGEHKVTLVIYSGLPDPVWTLPPLHEKSIEMERHLKSLKSTREKAYHHGYLQPYVGFKGFLMHYPEAEHDELIVGKETKDLQKILLDTMPDGLIPATLRQKVSQAIEYEAVSPYVPSESQKSFPRGVSEVPSEIEPYAPKLNLSRWNEYEVIRRNNNCYNYANDKITNSFAQPGYASGNPIQSLTPEEVLKSTMSDGLLKMDVPSADPPPEAPEQPNCLVALVVAEGVDYHWYRLDSNGFWSHKPGSTAATNLDGNGKLIKDPRLAANRPYGPDYKFVSFMQIFTNIIDYDHKPVE